MHTVLSKTAWGVMDGEENEQMSVGQDWGYFDVEREARERDSAMDTPQQRQARYVPHRRATFLRLRMNVYVDSDL